MSSILLFIYQELPRPVIIYVMNLKPAKILFTPQGYQQLKTDLQRYTKERNEVITRLQTAREMGDLSENAAYHAAKFELGRIDRELRRLNHLIRYGEATETKHSQVVTFGCQVTLDHGGTPLTFTLVSKYESDPTKQKLSVDSPIGQAILGKAVGSKVSVSTPSGPINYTISKVG